MRARLGAALLALGALAPAAAGCIGTTGGSLVTFRAAAAGVAGVRPGLELDTQAGYRVRLDRARLHVGSLYLNMSKPQAAGRETSCILPGIYVGQVTKGRVVDVLSPELQELPVTGEGTTERAVTGEVWFGEGDVNAPEDPTVVLDAAGEAFKDGASYPFEARLTIGQNRKKPPQSPALPGSNPICQERIVSPIAVDLTLATGGTLVLRIDPAPWFATVSFVELPVDARGVRVFADANEGQPSIALYEALHASRGVYDFSFEGAP